MPESESTAPSSGGRPRRSNRARAGPIADGFVARRLQLGLTQSRLAALAGVSRSSVQAIESGRSTVQLDMLEAVADVLGCDMVLAPRAGRSLPS
ncbi:helix-turn-helix transcriptional regulator [Rhodococcus sp. NPDC058505]|uniref:helix-turn-helix transcriptional regulator n=1 Tax=unclassified Rhodococcus (in: high G+C Gram-positive bacteria) TaxID=192944 RepID=UPI0036609482